MAILLATFQPKGLFAFEYGRFIFPTFYSGDFERKHSTIGH
jgi:hypothetical protein